ISHNPVVCDFLLAVEAEYQPLRVNAHESALRSEPIDQVPVFEILRLVRLSDYGSKLLACHASKAVAAQQIVHHPNPNSTRQRLLAFPGSSVKRTTAQVLQNRVAEKEPADCSDDAERRNESKNQKRPLHHSALEAGQRRGQRREPAAGDVKFVSERNGWLPFAAPPGWTSTFTLSAPSLVRNAVNISVCHVAAAAAFVP